MEPSAGLDQAALTTRRFTRPGINPLDEIKWVTRDAWPDNPKYNNPGILVPSFWRQNDLDVVSKLYLAENDPIERKSVRRLIERVCSKIVLEGMRHGYLDDMERPWTGDFDFIPFADETVMSVAERAFWEHMGGDNTAATLYAELCYITANQMAAWNSPVWFNVGRPDRIQQVSACYILGVHDNTSSIMETATRNAFIFKYGSGAGYNMSRIRSAAEPLSTGGTASGPMSFRRMWDGVNGTFKSGGMTRRGAELVCMDDDHPDIHEFIWAKPGEEKVMKALAKAGFNISMDEEGEKLIAQVTAFQNANMSVRLTDAFMRKVTGDDLDPTWRLFERASGDETGPLSACDLMREVAEAAWTCADPGVQYHDHFNAMHTTPMIDGVESPIRSTNPCGEYASNDDTSCNLASINVLKFVEEPTGDSYSTFDIGGYRHVVDTMILAMDILVELSDFPDDEGTFPGAQGKFRKYTQGLRQLGLGYANIGAAIMAKGLAYDSDEGRDFAASVMALTTGRAYLKSTQIAEKAGVFYYFDENREAMLSVIDKHMKHIPPFGHAPFSERIWNAADDDWQTARDRGLEYGFRNAQATVLAPTGSISYLMGCDTTGVEPAFSLVTYKDLAGGGTIVIVNESARRAAATLGGYSEENIKQMSEGDFSCVSEEDRPVFHGANEISYEGHIKMLGAVQPFVSGGISKTVNMHEDATVDDVLAAYILAWRLGVKNVAIYRNNSKVRQVLFTAPKEDKEMAKGGAVSLNGLDLKTELHGSETLVVAPPRSVDDEIAQQISPRNKMPRTRASITHKIHVRGDQGDHEGYLIAGMYEDGTLGELFLEGFGKLGGFTQNALSAWATDASIGMQYGMPMDVWCRKHAYMGDETGGLVVPIEGESLWFRQCTSIIDYIARWVAGQFGDADLCEELGVMTDAVKARKAALLDGSQAIEQPPIAYYDPTVLGDAERALAEVTSAANVNGSNGHGRTPIMGPQCRQCGRRMHRSGSCWACSCGNTTGCG